MLLMLLKEMTMQRLNQKQTLFWGAGFAVATCVALGSTSGAVAFAVLFLA